MNNILEQSQRLQADILLSVQGQDIVIKRGAGQAETTVYNGSAIIAPFPVSESLEGGYKAGFDSCFCIIPANVTVKRSDKVITENGSWSVTPGENPVEKLDGFNILQKITIIRKTTTNAGS